MESNQNSVFQGDFKMAKRKITKKELSNRISILLLTFFTFYLIEPVRTWASENLVITTGWQIIIGVTGILSVLYLFELR